MPMDFAPALERADQELQRRVVGELAEKNRPSLRRLAVQVQQGIVTLTGCVASFYEKQLAIHSCVAVAGCLPEAAAILVRHGERIEVPWAACSPVGKRAALNMRMYWEMLKLSVSRGANAFDFGRSTLDSGTYKFKAQWGAQPLQLHWYYWLPEGAQIPKLNQSNPKYELAVKAWQRMPLWTANLVGPWLVRKLP